MAVNVENPSTGISMTQYMRGRFEDAVALGVGVTEAITRNPKKALGIVAVAASLMISGNGEKVVTVPVDLAGKVAKGVENVGAGVGNFVFTEPTTDQPTQQQIQQNVAETVIGNMPQGATQAEQAQKLEQHGIAQDTYTDLSAQSVQTEAVTPSAIEPNYDPSLTGGAAPGQISGGSPAKP